MNPTVLATKEIEISQQVQVKTLEIVLPLRLVPESSDVEDLPLDKSYNLVLKRMSDLLIATIGIVVLVPFLFPLIILIIKCSSKGSAFFFQKRYKNNGKLFTCIKFRTMYGDTANDLNNNNRITKVGNFLRTYHIDEWPQLFNVFIGDMSIVGPRPHMISDTCRFEQMLDHYHFRHKVKPGITGLAQVNGFVGPVTSLEKLSGRVKMDKEYIRTWSLLLDIKIVCITIFRILRNGNQ